MKSKQKNRKSKKREVQYLVRFIVADPDICHGKPTYKGIRIKAWQILEQLEEGLRWEEILEELGGRISVVQNANTVKIARRAFILKFLPHPKDDFGPLAEEWPL